MSQWRFLGVITFVEQEIELALVRRLRAGDSTAFDEIYAVFNSRLLGFLTRMARNRSVAEDLLEETWLRLVSSAEDLRPDTRLVHGYLLWPEISMSATVALASGRVPTRPIWFFYGQANCPELHSMWRP